MEFFAAILFSIVVVQAGFIVSLMRTNKRLDKMLDKAFDAGYDMEDENWYDG